MDRSILNKYKKPEDKLLLSKIFDKSNFCETRNKLQVTDFLDLAEQNLTQKFLNELNYKNYIFFGGYENAERKLIIFYPEKLQDIVEENKLNFDEYIKVLKLTLPAENRGKYEHRIYLGALIKLGIKREKIGDILVDENGCDFLLHEDILKFVETNILQLTRFRKSELEQVKLKDIRNIEVKTVQEIITVSSIRLDNIIAELAKCSRGKAQEIIQQERVFINYELNTKQTKEIKENDRITIRGKGRYQIKQIIGNTKNGKIKINIEK